MAASVGVIPNRVFRRAVADWAWKLVDRPPNDPGLVRLCPSIDSRWADSTVSDLPAAASLPPKVLGAVRVWTRLRGDERDASVRRNVDECFRVALDFAEMRDGYWAGLPVPRDPRVVPRGCVLGTGAYGVVMDLGRMVPRSVEASEGDKKKGSLCVKVERLFSREDANNVLSESRIPWRLLSGASPIVADSETRRAYRVADLEGCVARTHSCDVIRYGKGVAYSVTVMDHAGAGCMTMWKLAKKMHASVTTRFLARLEDVLLSCLARGVLHGDTKFDNIMVDVGTDVSDGVVLDTQRIVLIDFGHSKCASPEAVSQSLAGWTVDSGMARDALESLARMESTHSSKSSRAVVDSLPTMNAPGFLLESYAAHLREEARGRAIGMPRSGGIPGTDDLVSTSMVLARRGVWEGRLAYTPPDVAPPARPVGSPRERPRGILKKDVTRG